MLTLNDVFAIVGCAVVVYLANELLWEVLFGLKAHVLTRFDLFKVDLKEKYGSWAVVTGSTDGIGKEYAKELARRGINIALISRSEEKLIKTATEIQQKYEVKTKIIKADFSKGQSVFEHIEAELRDIQVGILVNNVGKNYTYPSYLEEIPKQDLWDIININIGATVSLTRLLLPQMLKRKKGAIVNVSSGSELQPFPLMTVYAASKVFVRSFTTALQVEHQHSGITIQRLSPFFINTKMNNFSDRLQMDSLLVPGAEKYARNAVNTLGQVKNSTGYWTHGIQYFFTEMSPVWIRTYIGYFLGVLFRRDYRRKEGMQVPSQ